MTPELKAEAEALVGLLAPPSLLLAVLVVAVTAALVTGLGSLQQLVVRLGLSSPGRARRIVDPVRLVLVLVALYLLVRRVVVTAPVLGTLFVGVLLVATVITNLDRARSLVVGLLPRWRRRVRVGDRVTVGAVEGVVRDFGLFTLELETGGGRTTHLPNHLLAGEPLSVQHARDAVRVAVDVVAPPEDQAVEALARLRREALLSPYRVAASPVRVYLADDRVHLELQAWSKEAVRDATHQLDRAARRVLAEAREAVAEEAPDDRAG